MAHPNSKPLLSKSELSKYLREGLSCKDIGKKIGVCATTISRWSKKYNLEIMPPGGRNTVDITGMKFGRLTAIKIENTKQNGHMWLCRCDCGGEKVVKGSTLRKGVTNSCGCISFENNYLGVGLLSKTYWSRIVKGAKSRNLLLDVSIEDAWDLFEKQNRKCALSGIDLTLVTDFTHKHAEQNASLDRIDNNIGYTIENIHWVHKDINMMKRTMDVDYFIDLCSKIHKYNIV